MANVRVVFLKNVGSYKEGTIESVPSSHAPGYVSKGAAVYYADYSPSKYAKKEEAPKEEEKNATKKKASKKD